MILKKRIYGDKIVNQGRQEELDLAKSIMIFCLAIIHCIIECTPEEQLASGIPFVFDSVIGGPLSAPIYMFAMGIGTVYSREQGIYDKVKRGIKLLVMGYLLNICRFFIPYIIGYQITGDYEKYIEPLVYKVFCNDILQFAGLAFLVLALFQKLKMKSWQMFLTVLIASAIGTMLNGVDVHSVAGNIILGHFIGTEDAAGKVLSDFPLLNWIIFPISGHVFGKRHLFQKNKKMFYSIISKVFIPISIIYYAFGIIYERGMFGEGQNCYYHLQFFDALGALTSTFAMLAICYGIAQYFPPWLRKLSRNISENINAIYCIHWVLVVVFTNLCLYILRGTQVLTAGQSVLFGTIISVMSIILANVWRKIKQQIRKRKIYEKTQS